ncbi:hypothetical protein CC1G_10191 [Coprinopsis cinerea okayama7|uniref:DUF1783-domain-containing protein n=1 Tax=Coprinopsis cinerea (strain Okayama-7 / 130 / ATCC MYA-4618 / FGSC 9003) TaxID=240176 RepID=A8PGE0_COPC7|nr:hypothetical protein CC1G_10191 [Coprinopsis cinerea okayama7\|eukprot:XP_001841194.1 hypothetical protein CC1G_10191 [Coprinopsis cinerea okayama7\
MASLLRRQPCRLPQYTVLRQYLSTNAQRPAPPSQESPEVTTFSDTSRPRPYYAKHPPTRELPRIKSKWPGALATLAVAACGGALFMTYATNQEKLSSSVFRSIIRSLRADPQMHEALGDAIRPQPEWWLNGDPRVIGRISVLQGNIDVSFRVKGSKGTYFTHWIRLKIFMTSFSGSGTVYFTSIRKEKGAPFTVLRFKVICDDGTVVNISDTLPMEQP